MLELLSGLVDTMRNVVKKTIMVSSILLVMTRMYMYINRKFKKKILLLL